MNILDNLIKKNIIGKGDSAKIEKQASNSGKTIEEVLKNSDIVSLHIPLTSSTHHLISRERLAMMKKSAYLINIPLFLKSVTNYIDFLINFIFFV